MRLPSGDHAADQNNAAEVGWLVKMGLPSLAFHTCTVPSAPVEAMNRLSGDHATEKTGPVCPLYVCRGLPLAAFQTCTVLSPPTEAIYLPSGDQATDHTQEECPL